MKWFKHDTMASHDAKIKRLRLRHGLEGVGLYWSLLEAIARQVEPHNLLFELEEDSELIAIDFGISHEKVEMMMRTMIELDLFQCDEGKVTCVKLRERTDDYTQKLLRGSNSVRTKSGESPEKVRSIRIEENRREEKKSTRKTPLPENFSISDGVRDWAEKNGHRRLNAHLENFVDAAKAKNYQYVDWDSAFKAAVRKNWAGIQ